MAKTPVFELAEALCDLYGGCSMTEREDRVGDAAGILLRMEKVGFKIYWVCPECGYSVIDNPDCSLRHIDGDVCG